jgi:hypothetical protein
MKKSLSIRLYVLVLMIGIGVSSLSAQQGSGYLKAKVNTGRAGVFVDGKYLGPAANFHMARKYAVAPGSHELKLLEPRYEEFVTKVEIQAGKTTTINQDLKPLPLAKPPFGRLRIQNPDKFAAVYVNDRFMGHADEFNNFAQGLLLNPGEYEVRVEPTNGSAPITEKVTIEADKITRIGKS